MTRYIVTELEGWAIGTSQSSGSSGKLKGLSCHVIDTLVNRRVVATYRTEDLRGGTPMYAKRSRVRSQAQQHADRLNGERVAA
jgi:hypothetical protein